MSTFREAVEEIQNFKSCTDELCAKYKYIKQLPEWSIQNICPRCVTDRILAAYKAKVEGMPAELPSGIFNKDLTDGFRDGAKAEREACKSYLLEEGK
jgi:hypothetical protein